MTRAIPDSELDEFVDRMANRLGRFSTRALAIGKRMVNSRAGIPSTADLFMSQYVLRSSDLWEGADADLPVDQMNIVSDYELNMPSKL